MAACGAAAALLAQDGRRGQGVFLTVAASHLLSQTATQALVVVALGLLAESFGRDVWWLWAHRPGTLVAPVTDAHTTRTDAVLTPDASDAERGSGRSAPTGLRTGPWIGPARPAPRARATRDLLPRSRSSRFWSCGRPGFPRPAQRPSR